MTDKHMSDNDLDALIVRSLSRLPSHAPSRGFADRVMNRVALPSPRPVVAWRRARSWALQPRRAMALAGAYVLTATIAMIIAVPWLLRNSPTLRYGWDWVMARGAGMFREVAFTAASWAVSSGLTGLIKSIPLSGPQVWALALGATAAYAGCAIGLHHLLRAPRAKHATQLQA